MNPTYELTEEEKAEVELLLYTTQYPDWDEGYDLDLTVKKTP